MIKKYLFIIFIIVQFEHISAVSNNNLYYELYSFLAQVQDGMPELDPQINVKWRSRNLLFRAPCV